MYGSVQGGYGGQARPSPARHAGLACPLVAVHPEVGQALGETRLVDHHAHGVLMHDLQRAEFEDCLARAGAAVPAGMSAFDSQLGFAIRRWCAPVLGLEPFADPEAYLARRRELGHVDVNTRLLTAAGVGAFLLDGSVEQRSARGLRELLDTGLVRVHEAIDLEQLTEELVQAGTAAGSLRVAMAAELARRLPRCAGVSSQAGRRIGLGFDPARPSAEEVDAAAQSWVARCRARGRIFLDDEVLIRAGLWNAVDLRTVIQVHAGAGAGAVRPDGLNPLALTGFLRSVRSSGVRVVLLHSYPYHREAGYLAGVFEHVYCDAGIACPRVGSQAAVVIAEALEMAPFGKVLFGSDARGLAELHCLGAQLFRRGLAEALAMWEVRDGWPVSEQIRVVQLVGRQNAIRAYRLPGR